MSHRGGQGLGGFRPTTAKVLESLLATLSPYSGGISVLDLFAGTGQIGLGLLEQGASSATFVEGDIKIARELKRRIKASPYSDRCHLVTGRIPACLKRLKPAYGLVIADPPYSWQDASTLLPASSFLVEPGGLLIVEHHHKTKYEACKGWTLERAKKYGESRLTFFKRVYLDSSTALLIDPANEIE